MLSKHIQGRPSPKSSAGPQLPHPHNPESHCPDSHVTVDVIGTERVADLHQGARPVVT